MRFSWRSREKRREECAVSHGVLLELVTLAPQEIRALRGGNVLFQRRSMSVDSGCVVVRSIPGIISKSGERDAFQATWATDTVLLVLLMSDS